MRIAKLRQMFIVAAIAALFISYVGMWLRMISNPAERTGADFIHFYSAGRIAQIYGSPHVYDLTLQHDIEEQQVGFPLAPQQMLPYNHLPYLIPLLQLIVTENYVGSFCRWAVIMLITYVISVILFTRIFAQAKLKRGSIRLAAVGGLLFLPIFFSLLNGQDTALLFLGTTLWAYGLISNQPIVSGIGLSLTTVRPHIALVLALPMLFHQRKMFLVFILGSGVLAAVSFSILGIQGTREFIRLLLLTAGGEWYGMKQNLMLNFIGMLIRIFPWLAVDTIHLIGWLIYGITIIALCILWGKDKNLQDGRIGLTVILALFVAPHLHFHDLALLLIPIYELIRLSTETGILETSTAVTLPIAISILFLVINISPYLQFTIPYLIMLGLAVYPYLKLRMAISILHQP